MLKSLKNCNTVWHAVSFEKALVHLEVHDVPQISLETLECILIRCCNERNFEYAMRLHMYIHRNGLENYSLFGYYLIHIWVESRNVTNAGIIFSKMLFQDDYCWNLIISAHVRCGKYRDAVNLYSKMQEASKHPNAYTVVDLLKACSELKDINAACRIHAQISREGLIEGDLFVCNALVDVYAKCGLLEHAQELFDNLPVRDVVSWTSLIAGYAKYYYCQEALHCFELMQMEGLCPNAVTYVCSLKACGNTGEIDMGHEIHADVCRKGIFEGNTLVVSALVDMYAKCGFLGDAHDIFKCVQVRDIVSWNILISGYLKCNHNQEALKLFEQMLLDGFSPDSTTLICSMKACGNIGDVEKGREIHVEICRAGFLKSCPTVGNALIDMYAKLGLLVIADEVFNVLPFHDPVSWNSLISAYCTHEHDKEALKYFDHMQHEGMLPNDATFVCALKCCGSMGNIDKGQDIHTQVMRRGILDRNHIVGCALVDMYIKCGLLGEAKQIFYELPLRNVVLWTALIAGYVSEWHVTDALQCFEQMQQDGVLPNAVTYVFCLKACGIIGASEMGIEIHAEIARRGFLDSDTIIGNSLIDMYAKCGYVTRAEEVFERIPLQDIFSWNMLISGYSQLGQSGSAFHVFDTMISEGQKPDPVTFTYLLDACHHSGLVNRAMMYIESMSKEYGIVPMLEHDTYMVDIFSRAGYMESAMTFLKKVPLQPDIVSWRVILDGCLKWGNFEYGNEAFMNVMQ